jgi:hypothetical protein
VRLTGYLRKVFALTLTEMSACEPRSLQIILNNKTVKRVGRISLSINLENKSQRIKIVGI